MTATVESSLVRIYSNRGSVIGAGFLVSQKRILTCAHVVADALGIDRKTAEMPDQKISLDFPILAAKQFLTARVIFWRPVNPDEFAEDIAGLELETAAPDAARPAQLVTSDELWGHCFRVLGFPAGQHNGVWASGELRAKLASGWVQLEDVKQGGYRLEPGFSGAPIWDEKLQGVAGMAVANETKRPETKAAFIIPANVLIKAWPELGEQAIPACPYRGLFAFREQDAKFFFGRQKFTQQLVAVVQRQQLVAVIGPSGSGKSSVVLAGLIPKLREEGSWLIESFRPNKLPFYELAAALIGLLEPELGKTDKNIKAKELAESIRKHGFTADVSAILKDNPGKRLLLAIDQFEELYTGCADTVQQQFVDALLAAVESASHTVTLVLTLRADFYSYVVNYPPLGEALNKYQAQNLTLMKPEEMQAAIELPADKMNVKLEEKLTERILNDVKQEPGNLPLLEFALTQLWAKQSRGQLTHQAYSEIGGVAKALSNHAEAVYDKLSQGEQKKQAQRIFLQLVRPGEGTEHTRRVATRGEVGEECWELIRSTDGLADARLVVTGRNEATGEETVEVVHEALIREWGKLQEWIENDRNFLTWRVQLRIQMAQWNADKDEGALLRGKSLVIAEDWLQKRQADLTNEWEYIQASLDLRQKEIKERESQQQRITVARTLAICFLIAFLGLIVFFFRDWIKLALMSANRKHLAESNLAKSYLPGVDLSNGNLSKAKLREADLTKANLSGANLQEADFWKTYMPRSNLSQANLLQANLSQANLEAANLLGTNLQKAEFVKTYMPRANLSQANLSQANFSQANLEAANLSRANLSGADFQGTYGLQPDQIKRAKNWQQAIYDEEFRKKLGLK